MKHGVGQQAMKAADCSEVSTDLPASSYPANVLSDAANAEMLRYSTHLEGSTDLPAPLYPANVASEALTVERLRGPSDCRFPRFIVLKPDNHEAKEVWNEVATYLQSKGLLKRRKPGQIPFHLSFGFDEAGIYHQYSGRPIRRSRRNGNKPNTPDLPTAGPHLQRLASDVMRMAKLYFSLSFHRHSGFVVLRSLSDAHAVRYLQLPDHSEVNRLTEHQPAVVLICPQNYIQIEGLRYNLQYTVPPSDEKAFVEKRNLFLRHVSTSNDPPWERFRGLTFRYKQRQLLGCVLICGFLRESRWGCVRIGVNCYTGDPCAIKTFFIKNTYEAERVVQELTIAAEICGVCLLSSFPTPLPYVS